MCRDGDEHASADGENSHIEARRLQPPALSFDGKQQNEDH
jgi:hypothetical protein